MRAISIFIDDKALMLSVMLPGHHMRLCSCTTGTGFRCPRQRSTKSRTTMLRLSDSSQRMSGDAGAFAVGSGLGYGDDPVRVCGQTSASLSLPRHSYLTCERDDTCAVSNARVGLFSLSQEVTPSSR